MTATALRGPRAVGAIAEQMTALASWLSLYKPDCKAITLRRRDLELLQRHHVVAASYEIHTVDGVTRWRGFELRPDNTASEKPAKQVCVP